LFATGLFQQWHDQFFRFHLQKGEWFQSINGQWPSVQVLFLFLACLQLYVISFVFLYAPKPGWQGERVIIDSLMKTKNYDTITTFLSEYRSSSLIDKANNTGNAMVNQGLVSDYYFILHLRNGISLHMDSLKQEGIKLSEEIFNMVLLRDTARFEAIFIIYKDKTNDTAFLYPFPIKG
jgi:hypothetical protein